VALIANPKNANNNCIPPKIKLPQKSLYFYI
jgi:hypothetical protein